MLRIARHARQTRLGASIAAALLGAGLVLATAGCAGGGEDFTGDWGDAAASDQPSLSIEEGGAFSGTDGCNRLTGTAKISGDTIDFGVVASTMMACEGVDTWLNGLATGTIAGDALEISDADGNVIGSLPRQ
ncbi:META domain-containing protein [Leucobacter soli]|uniref:DUF306 domain-containing protein n=1 Tax=Leucobacter soli TaxID=2812850 RepID=A0A916K3G7_9MICO|nr:META domain-containing protein [Leucobacter soli]CAG7620151.1 hypothetical protein LEUCIP111803_02346 [Leucobacter soli]